MVKDYKEWKEKQNQDQNPDLKCLSDLLFVIKQYLQSPESHATKGVLERAIDCTEKWVAEKEYTQVVRGNK